jgi:tripartite-type tricarboxylate transporter receptor subunit TctC
MLRKILSRLVASLATAIVAPVIVPDTAIADTYPSRPIRWIVAYPPGGTSDIIVRLVAPELSKRLGQYVVIENRPGGAAIVGTNIAAKAAPDGYTLSVGYITTQAIHPSLMKSLPYDPIKDFIPVSLMGKAPLILVVNPSLPVKSLKELIAYAKSKPGQLNNSSPGNGSPPHLAGELFKKLAGLDIIHVPYKGSPEALQDTMTGAIQLTFGGVATALPHIRAGKLRPLGVSSLEACPLAPEIPPISKLGFPGFETTSWWGMSVRSGVPQEIVTRLNTELVQVIQLPEIRERFGSLGVVPTWSTPSEFDAYIKAEARKWGNLIRDYGIKVD